MTNTLVLYVTAGCHLCEAAQQIICSVLGFAVVEVEIIDDDHLLAQYGERIPVLRRTDTGAEAAWPFKAEDVRQLWVGG